MDKGRKKVNEFLQNNVSNKGRYKSSSMNNEKGNVNEFLMNANKNKIKKSSKKNDHS